MVTRSLDFSQALGSMRRIMATRFSDFDQTLVAEPETVENKFEGLNQAWVIDHQSSMVAVATKSEGLTRA